MIAVTGANGLLGSFIIRKLIEENEPFVALKRKNSDTSLLDDVQQHITWRDADVMDTLQLEEAFMGVTHVIHAAAIVSFNPRLAKTVMDINVMGTRNVVNVCLAMGIQKLVHISSVAALGRQKKQTTIDEKNQWVDSPINTVYAKSKYLAELEVFRGQQEGLPTVVINPSVILAPADWTKSSAKLFHYVWHENSFYTDTFLNYVDVRDVTDVVFQLLKSQIVNERFIVNAGNIHLEKFFQHIATYFNKKAPSKKLSPFWVRLVASLESFRTLLSTKEPLITKETARLAGTEFLYSNTKIKDRLKIEFQPIEKTLAWCCQYYSTKYLNKN